MIGWYSPANADDVICVTIDTQDELVMTLDKLRCSAPPSQIPAISLEWSGTSALTIAQVPDGAVLVWSPNEDLSFHTVGNHAGSETVTCTLGGQESEFPIQCVIPMETAIRAAAVLLASGVPGIPNLQWEQD